MALLIQYVAKGDLIEQGNLILDFLSSVVIVDVAKHVALNINMSNAKNLMHTNLII